LYDIGSDANKHTPMSIHEAKTQNLDKNIAMQSFQSHTKTECKGIYNTLPDLKIPVAGVSQVTVH
jgi:hypothetical protein